MSTDLLLVCKTCRCGVWVGQDGLSGRTLYTDELEAMTALAGLLFDHQGHALMTGDAQDFPEVQEQAWAAQWNTRQRDERQEGHTLIQETPQPHSITGYTRDDLYPNDTGVPSWLVEAEQTHGRMVKTTAMTLPGHRTIHVTRFAKDWRWTLTNPANPAGMTEADIWLTPEAMEASELLIALLYGPGESWTAHLEQWSDNDEVTLQAKGLLP